MSKYGKVTIRGKKYYRARITEPNGNRSTLYGKTQAELATKVAAKKAELASHGGKGNTCPTVAEYAAVQLSLQKSRVRPATYVGYEAKVRLYIATPPLGNMRLDEVTADDIEQAMKPVIMLSTSSYRSVYMLMRKIFHSAVRNHFIVEDPTEDLLSTGGNPKKDIPALTDEQVDALKHAVNGLKAETFVLLGLDAGLRREEILGLQWDMVHLDVDHPYITVSRAWHIEHNRPVVTVQLKTLSAGRDIPIPPELAEHLKIAKMSTHSDYVIANADGMALSGSQWRNLWKQVTRRTTAERTYKRYHSGQTFVHAVHPLLGAHATHNPDVAYSLDFHVTPHQLRYTYVTNLINAGADPKTVQYLAGHKNIKITMDIYARLKYNRPEDLAPIVNAAFALDRHNEQSRPKRAN